MVDRRLVVTADDFGLAPEVNEAVETAHRQGILSAASLMVSAEGAKDAIARAKRMPALAVGLHLVLTDGRPTLPPARIPDLVGPDGLFRGTMARLGAAIFLRPAVQRQLAAEIEAQFAAFRATGLTLDHVNAHRHFHLHPTIGRLVILAANRHGVRGLRVPVEPAATLAAVEPFRLGLEARLAAPFARLLAKGARRAGLLVPDQVFGLAWSGAMDAGRIASLIRHLPPGRSEIYAHPATADAFPGSARGYRYRDELSALTAPDVAEALRKTGIRPCGFAAL